MDYSGYLALKIILIICSIIVYICRSDLKKILSPVNEDQRPILDDYFTNEERRFVLVHPVNV
jgi:hypothetical protein